MRARLLLVPFVAAAALLAGCTNTTTPQVIPTPTTNGLEGMTADEILAKAQGALDEAKSFRVKGPVVVEGQTLIVDLVFAGSDVKGTMTVSGVALDVVRAGGGTYVKAPVLVWAALLPAEVQAMLPPGIETKYLKLPSPLAELVPTKDGLIEPEGSLTKGEITTVNGQPAITLSDSKGKLNISLLGKPYPIDLTDDKSNKLEFSEFDASVTITAPPTADVVDAAAFLS